MISKAPAIGTYVTYIDAVLYCKFLEYDGYRDWRLPTKDECVALDLYLCWYLNCNDYESYGDAIKLKVTPVRDI